MKDQKFLEIIEPEKIILIIASQPLDFDCVGSSLIIKKYLESLGKKVTVLYPRVILEQEKKFYEFLPYFDEIVAQDTREALSQKNFDVVIFLDGPNLIQFYDSLKEGPRPDINVYDKRIHIDHHLQTPENLGTYVVRDSKASSTAEVVISKIIPEEFIDKDIATLAYAAIVGDTGNFRWSLSPATLKIAALLLERGVDYSQIIDKLTSSKSRQYFEMLDYAIKHTEYDDDLGTTFLYLPYERLQKDSIDKEKLADLKLAYESEMARNIEGYPRGIIIREEVPGKIKISVRGNNFTNKINFPRLFEELGSNGGGHFNAAGMDIDGNFEEIKKQLIASIRKYLEQSYSLI